MLNINPTNSSKIAQSVQRDYQQAAEAHRLVKETSQQTKRCTAVNICLAVAVLVVAALIMGQFMLYL